jgi:hypothetical protein
MSINTPDWYLINQALIDGVGYPKSEENKKQLGYSADEIDKLQGEFSQNHDKELTNKEKQVILNCLAGALHYVTTDIPSLYDISESELKDFKESLEKRWGMHPTYKEK